MKPPLQNAVQNYYFFYNWPNFYAFIFTFLIDIGIFNAAICGIWLV